MDYEDYSLPIFELLCGDFLESTREKARNLDSHGHRRFGEGERLEDNLWCIEATMMYLSDKLSAYDCIHDDNTHSHREFSLEEINSSIDDLCRILDNGALLYFFDARKEAASNRKDNYASYREKQRDLYTVFLLEDERVGCTSEELEEAVECAVNRRCAEDVELEKLSDEEGVDWAKNQYWESHLLEKSFSSSHPRDRLLLSNTLLLESQYEALLNLMDLYESYKQINEFLDSRRSLSREESFRELAGAYGRIVSMHIHSEIQEHAYQERIELVQRKIKDQARGRKAHGKLEPFRRFARSVAEKSWNQEVGDEGAITTIKDMTDYILDTFLESPKEFPPEVVPAATTIRKWIVPLAPLEARKAGRPPKTST